MVENLVYESVNDLLILQNLHCYGNEWIVEIKDITDFVHEQYIHVKSNQIDKLMVAKERVYPVTDKDIAAQIGVDSEQQQLLVSYVTSDKQLH